jgi:hypothetical protein
MKKSALKNIGGTSHNRIYWKYWLISVAVLLLLRFTLFLSSSESARFYLFTAFTVITWIPTIIVFIYETRRHLLYLQAWFPQIPPRGPLVYPYILRIRSYVSKEELEEPAVQSIITRYRSFIHFMWVEFISFAVLYLAVMIDRDALVALLGKISS